MGEVTRAYLPLIRPAIQGERACRPSMPTLIVSSLSLGPVDLPVPPPSGGFLTRGPSGFAVSSDTLPCATAY